MRNADNYFAECTHLTMSFFVCKWFFPNETFNCTIDQFSMNNFWINDPEWKCKAIFGCLHL